MQQQVATRSRSPDVGDSIEQELEQRLGVIHARQRLGIEADNEPQVFGRGINFFHPENWYSTHSLIAFTLKLSGLYWIGYRNTLKIRLRHNRVAISGLPGAFAGFRLLHLSDLHADLNPPAMAAIAATISAIEYDACVITGDYRAKTYGPIEAALEHLGTVTGVLRQPCYGVFGNHDSIRMLPGIERLGVRMLLNEHVVLRRGDDAIYVVGVDDAHYYRVDNVANAAAAVPLEAVSILLSHTPEIYRQAAHAGFDLMLSGHTHGGQICLPGGIPVTLDAKLPRYMGRGAWRYRAMQGYTSVGAGSCIVPVRLNCPPEVTLHTLHPA
jgi:predicted MPP superfamily phosphohydrolase